MTNFYYISKDLYESIRPSGSQCPKLYGLPKTHKDGVPTRPILDMSSSAQYKISKLLIKILEPVSSKYSTFCIKDSFSFVEVIRKNAFLPSNMCSFDIKSLFTNVPVDETINICLNELYNSGLTAPSIPKDVCLSMLNMAVKNVEFRFNSYIYKQIDGVAMGSPLGPILANIFVGYFETLLFSKYQKPINYIRYVDDIFVSYNDEYNIEELFSKISNLHPNLKFTIEKEKDNCLPFLDVHLLRTSSELLTTVYRKPTFAGQYIPFQSFCPLSQKLGLISCLVFRAHKICSKKLFEEELDKIKNIFEALGYPSHIVRKTINNTISKFEKPVKFGPRKCPVYLRLPYLGKVATALEKTVKYTVNSTFNSVQLRISHATRKPLNGICKDRTADQEKSKIIYMYKCHCDSEYIGRTSQRFHIRRDQHVFNSLRRWMDTGLKKPSNRSSAIAEHLLNNSDCAKNYSDSNFSILSKARNDYHLSVLESLFIKTCKPNLCKQQYVYKSNLYKLL